MVSYNPIQTIMLCVVTSFKKIALKWKLVYEIIPEIFQP